MESTPIFPVFLVLHGYIKADKERSILHGGI